ncbi:MAG: rhodanese-like domain-containing protein, partial [Chloroflexi bacterium]
TLGSLFGIFAFGETVGLFDEFYNSSYMGRFTLPEFFGLPTGVVVLLVVFMALFMFWGSEQLERIFGGKDPKKAPKLRYAGAGVLTMAAVAVMVIGQPTTADRWNVISAEKEQLLQDRAVQIHPGELLATMHEHKVNLVMLDVRSEADYNLFHIRDARRVDIETLPELAPELLLEPSNTVFVLMSNGETAATEAWKVLAAESVPNIYILEGGINAWLAVFAEEDQGIQSVSVSGDDRYQFIFNAALGSSYHAARPHPEDYQLEYIPKIQLQNRKGPSGGGCG